MNRRYGPPSGPDLPDLKPGDVLILKPSEVRHVDRRLPLRLRLETVRDDLAAYYDEHVWLEGQQLSADGTPEGRLQVLVQVSAIPAAIQRAAAASPLDRPDARP